jgi:hypothetical protein
VAEPAEVYRRRRLVALAALLGVIGLVVAVIAVLSSGGGSSSQAARDSRSVKLPPPPPQLPRGGREILPRYRVVAYYGAPQDVELGALGIGRPDQAVARLEKQAKPYAAGGRPVLPVLELIAVVAAHDPGEGGRYNLRQPDSVIRRYLKAARKAKALLILDIQPGRSDFFTEAKRLRKWLKEPDVGLALDPEWRMAPGQIPGQVIGSVGAREVNATSAWLDQLVTRYNLPQKLLLVHEFTDDMVPEAQLKQRKGLAYVMNVDGFGGQALKIAKYKGFAGESKAFRRGFKLFYQEDQGIMSPAQVMRLQPRPDVVVYE